VDATRGRLSRCGIGRTASAGPHLCRDLRCYLRRCHQLAQRIELRLLGPKLPRLLVQRLCLCAQAPFLLVENAAQILDPGARRRRLKLRPLGAIASGRRERGQRAGNVRRIAVRPQRDIVVSACCSASMLRTSAADGSFRCSAGTPWSVIAISWSERRCASATTLWMSVVT
jgi:hypothetical protein